MARTPGALDAGLDAANSQPKAAGLPRISNGTELAMTETMEMMVMMTEARLHFQVVWIQRPISDSTGDVSGRQQEMCYRLVMQRPD